MTTTMSFFNPAGSAKGKSIFFHLYRTGVKRFLGLGCLYTIFLQLTYTLPMFFNVKHARANWAEEPIATVKALLSAYSYGAVFMTSALVCLCAILFSTVAYSYMHNRRGADFYHSLPAPRETLLLANFSAVFTWLALPLLASGVLCLLFFPGLGVPVPLGAAIPAYFIFHGPWLLLLFVLMSLTAFVAVNAATVIETAGYTCAFSVMGSFLYYI